MVNPLIAGLGTPEILIIIVVVMLLFGAKKLPELARGSGQALRIFKAETKGLLEDDEKTKNTTPISVKSEAQLELEQRQAEMRLAQEKVDRENAARERRTEPNA